MSEPYVPVPPPERNSYWNPEPARCIECGSIVDVRRGPEWDDGEPDAYCSHCDRLVISMYPDSQSAENEEEDRVD